MIWYVYQCFHASSHHGKGLQQNQEAVFRCDGGTFSMDEAITDFLGYYCFCSISLTSSLGAYDTNYLVPRNRNAPRTRENLNKYGGLWLSSVLFCPMFDGEFCCVRSR